MIHIPTSEIQVDGIKTPVSLNSNFRTSQWSEVKDLFAWQDFHQTPMLFYPTLRRQVARLAALVYGCGLRTVQAKGLVLMVVPRV